MNWLTQTKFQLAAASFLAALGLLVFAKMDSAQWVSFNTWLLGLYFGSDVAQSAVTKSATDVKS